MHNFSNTQLILIHIHISIHTYSIIILKKLLPPYFKANTKTIFIHWPIHPYIHCLHKLKKVSYLIYPPLTYDTSKVLRLTSLWSMSLKCVDGSGKGIFKQTNPLKKLLTNPMRTKFCTMNMMFPTVTKDFKHTILYYTILFYTIQYMHAHTYIT